jgi:hypothetical protein
MLIHITGLTREDNIVFNMIVVLVVMHFDVINDPAQYANDSSTE